MAFKEGMIPAMATHPELDNVISSSAASTRTNLRYCYDDSLVLTCTVQILCISVMAERCSQLLSSHSYQAQDVFAVNSVRKVLNAYHV